LHHPHYWIDWCYSWIPYLVNDNAPWKNKHKKGRGSIVKIHTFWIHRPLWKSNPRSLTIQIESKKKDFSFITTKKEEDIDAPTKVILETNLKQLWQMKTHCCTCHGKFRFFVSLVQIWFLKRICVKFHQIFNIKKMK
jgi:hypothetical protein